MGYMVHTHTHNTLPASCVTSNTTLHGSHTTHCQPHVLPQTQHYMVHTHTHTQHTASLKCYLTHNTTWLTHTHTQHTASLMCYLKHNTTWFTTHTTTSGTI